MEEGVNKKRTKAKEGKNRERGRNKIQKDGGSKLRKEGAMEGKTKERKEIQMGGGRGEIMEGRKQREERQNDGGKK